MFCNSLLNPDTQKLIRIYYYDATLKQSWDQKRYRIQQQYFQSLRSQENVELRLGRLQGKYPNIIEKGLDVQLSTDLVRFAHNNSYEIGNIISADADFVPAIQLAKDMGKIIHNSYFPNEASFHIKNIVDKFVPINKNLISTCQMKQQPLFEKKST